MGGERVPRYHRYQAEERVADAHNLRCIFSNPFNPPPFDPSWCSEAVVALARQQYEGNSFSLMPILADALEDAGCGDERVLDHCRGPNVHYKGCWVVDLVLGKS